MKIKQVKLRNPDGTASYEDFTDINGIVDISLAAYAAGERSPKLMIFINWLIELGRKPTADEFETWFKAQGGTLPRVNTEPHEN